MNYHAQRKARSILAERRRGAGAQRSEVGRRGKKIRGSEDEKVRKRMSGWMNRMIRMSGFATDD
jgi:hypothetical protein